MKFLLASDSFKGNLTSLEVEQLMEEGIKRVYPQAEIKLLPVADGGEGTVTTFVTAGAKEISIEVQGPLGQPVQAKYALFEESAIIEMAQASGITYLTEEQRNPLQTSTYGTGQLILHALQAGYKKLVITLGGSATNDGGMGALAALGAKFYNASGQILAPNGQNTGLVTKADLSAPIALLADIQVTVACDVDNVLLGARGASQVFGPQKGATPAVVDQLEENLCRYATVMGAAAGKDCVHLAGAGAAGGLGFGLMLVSGAQFCRGIQLVLDLMEFDKWAQWSDIIFTGEGRIDFQTAFGKVPAGVATRAKRYGKPVFAVGGSVQHGLCGFQEYGLDEVISAVYSVTTKQESIASSRADIPRAVERTLKIFKLGSSLALK